MVSSDLIGEKLWIRRTSSHTVLIATLQPLYLCESNTHVDNVLPRVHCSMTSTRWAPLATVQQGVCYHGTLIFTSSADDT